MSDQTTRGLEGHPSELKRMREIAAKLSGYDAAKEEIGYSAEELAEAANGDDYGPMSSGDDTSEPGCGGPQSMITSTGATSNS